ncbi:MAG: serine hydrolase domain-containing protein [Candidatus Heimdallarchaeota archaeon]
MTNDEIKQKILDNLVEIVFEGAPKPKFESTKPLVDRMKHYKIPGVSIAIIDDYKIAWAHNEGVKDKVSNKKVDENTLFEAASTTKPLTAAAALHLVEQGILALDEDVNKILKDWKIPDNEFTKNEKVTLRRLLTHKAGISRPDSLFGTEEGKVATIIQVLNGEKPALNDPAEIIFEPGSDHAYSNLGFIIVEKLMQDATGKSYKQLMKEIIFDPLEMKNSTFEVQLPEKYGDNFIKHHTGDGETKGIGVAEGYYGHGGLRTTSEDLAKFTTEIINAYQGKSSKIFSQAMAKTYLSNEQKLDPEKYFGLFTGQAQGFFLIENERETFFILPGENSPGAICFLVASHTSGKGACIMSNGAQGSLLALEMIFSLVKENKWDFGP